MPAPEQLRPVTVRASHSNEPVTPEERVSDAIWSDAGWVSISDFDGAVYANPQPELDDDAVTVVLTDGRTVAVQSIDLVLMTALIRADAVSLPRSEEHTS